MRADPQRADELKSIGPPSSFPGWAPRIWPRFDTLISICSGTFATALPKVGISGTVFQKDNLISFRQDR